METNNQNKLNFQAVYGQYKASILRYVGNMVGEAEAEDLTQEIFIKINQALPGFRGESKLSTWIYRIATNTALDRLRQPTYQQMTSSITGTSVESKEADRNIWTGEKIPTIEWQVVRKEMGECIQEYIQKLPANYRFVLVLCEIEGFKNQEIAEIMGIPMSTVKIRLHRARERLKKDLIANCPSYWVDGNEFLPDLKNL